MRKNNFLDGAIIATIGIVLSKILGIIYVIPFYAIIGDEGGALYGYSYTVYTMFLTLSTVGIPLAMSKLISEYNTLKYYYTKERAYKTGKYVMLAMGIVTFIVLTITAPLIAKSILGGVEGGNTPSDVAYVIRIISFAVLIVPVMSVSRGYLQGHKYITPTSISEVLEQVVRVLFIICGSFLTLKVLHLSLTNAIGVAVFGATIGALASYLYLISKIHQNKKSLKRDYPITRDEAKITSKTIIKKLLVYALPFIMIDIAKSLYNVVDAVTVVKTMVHHLNYTAKEAESVIGIINTWGLKLNMIVIAIATGLVVSLIPSITSSFVLKKYDEVKNKINKSFQILLYITIPMTVGLSLLSVPVWTIFYGFNLFNASVFAFYIFVALFLTLFTVTITILQSLNQYKIVFTSLFSGLMVKIIFNIPFMYAVYRMGFASFYGNILASIMGYLTSIIIGIIYLNRHYQVDFKDTVNKVLHIILAVIIMTIAILLFQFIIPLNVESRLLAVIIVGFYALLGGLVYFVMTVNDHTFYHIFGINIKTKLRSLIHKHK